MTKQQRHAFDPRQYWEARISANPNLRGTGHRAFSIEYNTWLYRAQHDCLNELLALSGVETAGRRVLDVGSGVGFYVDYFLNQGARSVVGIDIAPSSVNLLRHQYPTGRFVLADIAGSVDSIGGPFDIVSMMNVMFHVLDDERFDRALCNACGLLPPKGVLVVSDTFSRSWIPRARHTRFRHLRSYEPILAGQGMTTVAILPVYYVLSRSLAPLVGPFIISLLGLAPYFYRIDRRLRRVAWPNCGAMKMALFRKSPPQ